MNYFQSANELVTYSKENFLQIIKSYNESLHEKNIKSSLLIEIKNFMENLRSALDYSAHGLYEKYGDKTKDKNIYFPYAWSGLSLEDFRKKNIIENKIPGLSKSNPAIITLIESFQYFSDMKNAWLPLFMDLNNENKHQNLTPQIRKESKQLNITSGGASLSMGEGCNISIGIGASVQLGSAVIMGGQNINVNNPAPMIGSAEQEINIWVSFLFQSNSIPVIPLLTDSLNGTEKIVYELSRL